MHRFALRQRRQTRSPLAAALLLALVSPLSPQDSAADTTAEPKQLATVTVNAVLDQARNQLSPSTGSSLYVFTAQAIQALPLGESTPLNQVLLQAPGVVQDSHGQLHVRGDHANLQYRIDGIILPESISGFGQTLDTRLIHSMSLLTGALPAQYGLRTAGVIDIRTRSGARLGNGGSVGVTTGSHGTLEPWLSLHGHSGRWSWFFSGDYLKNDLGIENPVPTRAAIHDKTWQGKGFGELSYLLNDSSRISVLAGVTNNRFQIPDNPDQAPVYSLAGVNDYPSADPQRAPARADPLRHRQPAGQAGRHRLPDRRGPTLQPGRFHARCDRRSDLQRRRLERGPQQSRQHPAGRFRHAAGVKQHLALRRLW
ncbi:TonB-dependent outer membrane receptor [mine drainage metagenome]|uniref:TonB-dependent outer membrane receptor n=1 Tax=mine drainage metagenome TaxID=410659 RepID=T1BCB9_9ZZZZ